MNQYVPCPLPAINLHQFLSRQEEGERFKKKKWRERKRDQPTMKDLHEPCHLSLIDLNYDTNTISCFKKILITGALIHLCILFQNANGKKAHQVTLAIMKWHEMVMW